MKIYSISLFFLLSLSVAFTVTVSAQAYKLVDLQSYVATALNDSDAIAIIDWYGGDSFASSVWKEGTKTNIGALYPGGATEAYGINKKSQVVGSSWNVNESFKRHAFRWTNGVMTDLGTLGGSYSAAMGINDSGDVTGRSIINDSTGVYHGFIWKNGLMTDLGTLGIGSEADGINNSGQIAGSSEINDTIKHAFLWQNGSLSDLGTLGGNISDARGINNRGEIVGTSTLDRYSGSLGYIASGGGMTGLGFIAAPDIYPGSSGATAINDSSEVVGGSSWSRSLQGNYNHAFVWKDGIMTDLNSVTDTTGGWEILQATAINNRGDILATAIFSGYQHAVLLKKEGIVITRPQAQELWISREKQTIRWIAPKGKLLNIFYTDNDRAGLILWKPIAQGVRSDSGKYEWIIPDGTNTQFGRVRIEDASDPLKNGTSDRFRIRTLEMVHFNPDSTYTRFQKGIDSWSFNNIAPDMWPLSWTNRFYYQDEVIPDPYLNKPYPAESPFDSAKGWDFPDWPLFVRTFRTDHCYQPTLFGTSYDQFATAKWKAIKGTWGGSCSGLSLSCILGFDNRAGIVSQYSSYPAAGDLNGVSISDSLRLIINGLFFHWYGKQHQQFFGEAEYRGPRQLIEDLGAEFLNENNNHAYLYISWINNAGETNAHAIVPYKLERDTSRAGWYTVRVYDVSYPGSNLTTILIDSTGDSALAPFWSARKLIRSVLMDPAGTYLQFPDIRTSASPRIPASLQQVSDIEIWPVGNPSVRINRETGGFIQYHKGSLVDSIRWGFSFIPPTASPSPPVYYGLPDDNYTMALGQFTDRHTGASKFSYRQSYSYERFDADSTQTDLLTFDHSMAVGSHDDGSKVMTIESIGNSGSGSIKYRLSGMTLLRGDSVRIEENDGAMTLINLGSPKVPDIFVKRVDYYRPIATYRHGSFSIPGNSTLTFSPGSDSIGTLRVFIDNNNDGTYDDTVFADNQVTGVDDRGDSRIPTSFVLHQNYPNPFNPRTTITYEVPGSAYVTLKVYDVFGREVATLVDGIQNPGFKSAEWNATNVASGVYFYRLQAGAVVMTKKLILMR